MSYRLIDANAIASQLPEVNDMPCIYADLDKGLDGCHYDLRGANTLQAENSKLRNLVRDMMRFFEDGDYCTACEKVAECDAQEEYDDGCLMRGVFHARMRELGVDESFEATLGRGTCYLISALQYGDDCKECSACGAVADEYMFDGGYCPNCGAKVVN